MEAERDLAGLVLPFAVGVAAIIYAESIFCRHSVSISSFTMLASAAGLTALIHPLRKEHSATIQVLLIALTSMAVGMLCASTSLLTSPVATDPFLFISKAGRGIEAAISRMEFNDRTTNAIIKALIIGDKSEIPSDIAATFRNSGASHILALSGLHLGIIYGIVSKVSGITGNSPAAVRTRSFITITLCGLYTLATGAGPSITRAFLFIVFSEAARLTGRQRKTGLVLLGAMLIQLTISPDSIRSAGFQLSYAAMAGIAFIFPWLNSFWPEEGGRWRPIRWIWTSAAMSISCQLTTGPIAFIYFGTLPKYFLLTNLIAIPLTGIIIPTALATLILSSCGICPDILLRATEMLVQALSEALNIISSM